MELCRLNFRFSFSCSEILGLVGPNFDVRDRPSRGGDDEIVDEAVAAREGCWMDLEEDARGGVG